MNEHGADTPAEGGASSPEAVAGAASALNRLIDLMAQLRAEGGCPWDREQTLCSLKPYLLEEAYEVVDAIDSGDPDRHAEELGDLLMHVVLQSQIRREQGEFGLEEVARGQCEKLIRRHPHVFGDAQAATAGEVVRNWVAIKAREKGEASLLDGIPRSSPALQRAHQVQQRAARVGFDWAEAHDVLAKVREELAETEAAVAADDAAGIREEIGDLLFAVVNLARFLGHDSEEALTGTVAKFMRRFRQIERQMAGRGKRLEECTLEEMDRVWESVKREEAAGKGGAA